MTFKSHQGAIVDRISRPEPLTPLETELAEWAAARGLFVTYGKAVPEDGDPYFTYQLGVEEMVNGQIAATFHEILTDDLPRLGPQGWELCERMLRHRHEATKREAAQ